MNRKVILLIDMDGVIAGWYPGLVNLYKEKYPDRSTVPAEEVTQFFVEGFYPEEHREDVLRIARTRGFYTSLPVIDGAKEALKDIEENCLDFIEPFICTAPEMEFDDLMCHSEKVQWLNDHFGEFWATRAIITKDKTLVMGDYLIDDKPKVKGVRLPDWQHIHYAQPYNNSTLIADYRFTWDQWNDLKMDLYKDSNARKFLV
jgi:5'-nucleotidase